MAIKKLGKLEEVKVREIWEHEQYDFSNWLAKDENIALLGDALNLSFTDIETEKSIGSYRCDIIAKDELTNKAVLIENQLEQTNHDHLGKLITYASGLDASVVIWIVETARSEHSSAIEWLNKYTSEDLSFFLIEIHAYKIGDSEPAPYFKIIEQPNDFAKAVKYTVKGRLTQAQEYYQDFWNKFNEELDKCGKPFNKRKASPVFWYSVAIGTAQCHIEITLVNKEYKIRVGLLIPNNKDLFESLYEYKDEIEAACGPLDWDKKDNKKATSINSYIDGLDFSNQDNYPELMNEIIDRVVLMRKTFKKYL